MKRVTLIVLLITGISVVYYYYYYYYYFRNVEGNPLINDEYKNSSAYINNLYMSDEYF